MVAGLGFDGIIASLSYGSYASSQAAMCALIERWMDTTHTFEHPPESGFPRLPRWIRKTTGLIESFAEARDLLGRSTHDQV